MTTQLFHTYTSVYGAISTTKLSELMGISKEKAKEKLDHMVSIGEATMDVRASDFVYNAKFKKSWRA